MGSYSQLLWNASLEKLFNVSKVHWWTSFCHQAIVNNRFFIGRITEKKYLGNQCFYKNWICPYFLQKNLTCTFRLQKTLQGPFVARSLNFSWAMVEPSLPQHEGSLLPRGGLGARMDEQEALNLSPSLYWVEVYYNRYI